MKRYFHLYLKKLNDHSYFELSDKKCIPDNTETEEFIFEEISKDEFTSKFPKRG